MTPSTDPFPRITTKQKGSNIGRYTRGEWPKIATTTGRTPCQGGNNSSNNNSIAACCPGDASPESPSSNDQTEPQKAHQRRQLRHLFTETGTVVPVAATYSAGMWCQPTIPVPYVAATGTISSTLPHWLYSPLSVPSDSTGTIAGNRHYSGITVDAVP